ncbi:MAG: hypothetical protein EXR77_09175 [Myxococcales bacterium]|nr:hypothetical protein [Myxococcales bacterium]
MTIVRFFATIFAATLLLASCQKGPEDEAEQVAPATLPQPLPISDEVGPFVLRYFAPASGQLVPAKTVAEVPEGARAQVIVTYDDPALHGPWLFVADLTQKVGTHYTVRSVDRVEMERQLAAAQPKQPTVAPAEPAAAAAIQAPSAPSTAAIDRDVVIYRTVWCGYCKKAAEYLRLKGVAFVEKDLETDSGAREDMLARAKKAGVPESRLQGVPILSVKGKIINGFDRAAIDRALGG